MNIGSEKTYCGKYTLEKIYDLVGRNDYVSTITFRPNTQSEKLYGNTLTIVFLYTQQERVNLEHNIKTGVTGTHGYVKAKYLLFDLPDTKIKELEEVGVNSNDITNIEWLPYTELRNTYGSKEKRHIDTITIESKPSCYENDILWMYGALKTYKEKGIGLCPEEQDKYLAYKLILEPAKLTEEENAVIYDANGKMNEDIAYVYLGYKCVTLNISKEEIIELIEDMPESLYKTYGYLGRKTLSNDDEKAMLLHRKVIAFTKKGCEKLFFRTLFPFFAPLSLLDCVFQST